MSVRARETLDPQEIGGSLRDYLDGVVQAPLPIAMQTLLAQLHGTQTTAGGGQRPAIVDRPQSLGEATDRAPKRYTLRRFLPTPSHIKRWTVG